MLNYIKSELYRAAHSKELRGAFIGLLAIILFLNLTLFLMKDVEHFRYGSSSFSYSMLVSVPMMYCYVAADVAAMLYESDRRNGTMGNSIAYGISRMQLLAGKCVVCFVASLVMLAVALHRMRRTAAACHRPHHHPGYAAGSPCHVPDCHRLPDPGRSPAGFL